MAARGIEPNWSTRLHAADWVRLRLGKFGSGVGSILPQGFEAYACILHPFSNAEHLVVRWSEVARQMRDQARTIPDIASIILDAGSSSSPPLEDYEWPEEALNLQDAEVLLRELRSATKTADTCWFCIWNGYGDLNGNAVQLSVPGGASQLPTAVPLEVLRGPRVELPGREYWLFEGPLEHAVLTMLTIEHGYTPNLWWPEDRAWCVASEIDLSWSYVGGSQALIDQLLVSKDLEVLPSSAQAETVLPLVP